MEYNMDINELRMSKYYRMSIKKGSNVTYMYTGDFLPEGEYCIFVRGLLKNKVYLHTIIAGVVPYTGHKNDIILHDFNKYDHIVAISVTEEAPQFSKPSESFFKILKCNSSCFPSIPPDHY